MLTLPVLKVSVNEGALMLRPWPAPLGVIQGRDEIWFIQNNPFFFSCQVIAISCVLVISGGLRWQQYWQRSLNLKVGAQLNKGEKEKMYFEFQILVHE